MNKKIKNKSNNNMNIANFCNDNINNKKYKKYYDFLNNPMNIFITTQYIKFLYTESIKNKMGNFRFPFRGDGGNRTPDTRIFSPLLYRLSYITSPYLWGQR